MQKELETNFNSLNLRISLATKTVSKDANDIFLIAVSKKKSLEHIKIAQDIGIKHFGENYAQELEEKVKQLNYKEIIWHFIGPLQSNKAKSIAINADWIHSLDREKIANKIAYVISGGDLSQATFVDEQYLLDLEREAFLSLCSERKTLERIQSILKTGKPLRN